MMIGVWGAFGSCGDRADILSVFGEHVDSQGNKPLSQTLP